MNYWEQRLQQLNSQLEKDESKLKSKLSSYYDIESRKLENEIGAFYQQYGKDNIVEYRTLMQAMSAEDKKMLIERMNDFGSKYPEYEHILPVRENIYKLNRLEGLQQSLLMQQYEMGAIDNKTLQQHLQKQALLGANAMAKELGFGENFYSMNPDIIKKLINQKWANGKNFSDDIWNNRQKLADYLNQDFAAGIARGDSYERLMQGLRKRFSDVSRRDMHRLIYTEGTFAINEGMITPFEEEFEEYRFSIADSNACGKCQAVNGKKYSIKDRKPGVNFPPLHSWCRCSFTIEIPDDFIEQYEAKHGGKQPSEVLQDSPKAGIMKSSNGEFPRISGSHSRIDDLKNTNPDYAESRKRGSIEYTHNCQRCVSAYEARRRGYDVTAKGRYLKKDPLAVMVNEKGWANVYEGGRDSLIACFSNSTAGVKKKVTEQVLNWGEDARAIVRVQWKGGGGHVFISECHNGEVIFVDPQNGMLDASGYFDIAKVNKTHLLRIDNKEFTTLIEQCCKYELP